MQTKNTPSGRNFLEMFIIMMVCFCALLVIIGFMTVFNVVSHGWVAAAPLIVLVVGMIYFGNSASDKWTFTELPGAHFALSLGAGVLLGVLGVGAKLLFAA